MSRDDLRAKKPRDPAAKEAMRQRFRDRARKLLEGDGTFTVERLVREVGVSVGAFYLYYQSDRQLRAELLAEDLKPRTLNHADALRILSRYIPAELREVLVRTDFLASEQAA